MVLWKFHEKSGFSLHTLDAPSHKILESRGLYVASSNAAAELAKLGDEKGKSHSQVHQDKLVAALTRCQLGGYFLDIAANHPIKLSNTRALERDLGWDGICVEGNTEYAPLLMYRKC